MNNKPAKRRKKRVLSTLPPQPEIVPVKGFKTSIPGAWGVDDYFRYIRESLGIKT